MQSTDACGKRYEWSRGGSWNALPELHKLEGTLGLTPVALLKPRWGIVDEPVPETEGEKVVDIRTRLKAVE